MSESCSDESDDGFQQVTNKPQKTNLKTSQISQTTLISSTSQTFRSQNKPIFDNLNNDKTWEITDMYLTLKDWCDEQAILLLDECDSIDLYQFVHHKNGPK